MHKLTKLSVLLVLGLVFGGVGSGFSSSPVSAAASNVCEESNDPGPNGALTCWYSDGDQYKVCDIELVDGMHAEGTVWWYDDSKGGWIELTPLSDDDDQYCDWGNINIPEDVMIRIRACSYDDIWDVINDCDYDYTRNYNG